MVINFYNKIIFAFSKESVLHVIVLLRALRRIGRTYNLNTSTLYSGNLDRG